MDELTRECLTIDVARKLGSDDVLEQLAWLMATRAMPQQIRSDNGSEFPAAAIWEWQAKVGVKTLYVAPARSPLARPTGS